MFWYTECNEKTLLDKYKNKKTPTGHTPYFLFEGCQHGLIYHQNEPHWNCCGSHDPDAPSCRPNTGTKYAD